MLTYDEVRVGDTVLDRFDREYRTVIAVSAPNAVDVELRLADGSSLTAEGDVEIEVLRLCEACNAQVAPVTRVHPFLGADYSIYIGTCCNPNEEG